MQFGSESTCNLEVSQCAIWKRINVQFVNVQYVHQHGPNGPPYFQVCLHACCTLTLFLYFSTSFNILVKMFYTCLTGFSVCSNTYKPIDFRAEFYLPCIPISRISSNCQ